MLDTPSNPYVPSVIRQRIDQNKHLPKIMRDSHDQKDLFKAIDNTFSQPDANRVNWVDAHIYTIDTFLWVMAAHGYHLQKSRNVFHLDLKEFIERK
jgi:hypothetical protein